MTSLKLIQQLDHLQNHERREIIVEELEKLRVEFYLHRYSTGINVIVNLGKAKSAIGVSSHYDKFEDSGGANDNGSAIAVCLNIIEKYKASPTDFGIRVLFFDEEETGLKGSTAYVKEFGLQGMVGLINMELVGIGDKLALWPVNSETKGSILERFESVANHMQIHSHRFDQIITNTADHLPFRKAGLKDSFTITCISDRDIEIAQHYYKALELGVDRETLAGILLQAPVFANYHAPTDTFDKLSEETIGMTSSVIWETISNHDFDQPIDAL